MKIIIFFALLLVMGAPVFAVPATPTELDLNLSNTDGSNIDTNLLLTIDYTDGDSNPQSMNSTGSAITWGVFFGKSNMYAQVPAKGGTDINITIEEYRTDISVERYETLTVTAVEGGYVSGNYNLSWISQRPTDTGGGIDGAQHLLPQLYNSTGGNFVIHWTTGADGGSAADAPDLTDSDFDGTPDFVEDFASYFETSYTVITGRGFNAPSSDAAEPNDGNNRNPDGKYDVFIYNMSRYGYTNAEQYPFTPSYSYTGADNDYAGAPLNQDPDGNVKGTMKITAAHAVFHAVQFTYDTKEEKWWMETTSTYMEDEVYPATNDNYNYLAGWLEFSDMNGLKTLNGLHEYGNFIFAKRLSEDFGDGVIKSIWEEMGTTDGLTAIDNVLAASGSGIMEEFRNFTMANFFLEDMYVDGAEYRAAIAGDTTFDGVWIEAEYDEAVNGTPITIDIGNVNYDAWMNMWATDYVTLDMSGGVTGYAITFDGFDNSVNYDVSLVTKAGGVINTTEFTLDGSKEGTVDLLYDPAYTDVILIIRNSGDVNTTNPTWKVKIRDLFIPPGNTVIYTYTNDTDVPIPDNDGWVSSEITVPPGDSGTIQDLLVYVGIDHWFRGDLNVDLISPLGTRVGLHVASDDSAYHIYTWYDNESTTNGTGSLDDFNDEESGGTWELTAQDTWDGDTGFINTWSLKLYVDRPPVITMASPQNITYTSTSVALDVSASEEIDTWWYSLNSGANTSFIPNTTITATEGSNSLTVYANDTTAHLASSSVYFTVDTTPQNITAYNISLNQEWNLISIPLEQDNWNITSVLAPIEGNYTVVFAYIDDVWEKSTAARDPLTNMSLEYGYWIYMTAPDTLELSGTVPATTTINIVAPGWNLVGYPSFTTRNITDVLSSINYSVVFAYIDDVWEKSTAARDPLTEMTTGFGYWIYANEAGSYRVGDSGLTIYDISLNQDWNLISIPLEQDNWNITSVLAPIDGNYSVVFAYIDDVWEKSTAARDPLTEMSLEYGYWIYMTAPDTLELNGTVPATTTINILGPGWNLVGYPSFTTRNITDVLSSINYSVVFAYIDDVWEKSTAARDPLTEMTTGLGYWIYANEVGSYDVGNP